LHRQRGFTMVELIVVMVLVGILGAIAGGRFFERGAFESQAVGEQVRAMLRYAQKTAIARNAPVFVRFEENRISLCHAEPKGACAPAAYVPSPGGFSGGDEASSAQCGTANWYCIGRPAGLSWDAAPLPDFLAFDGLGRPFHPNGRPGGMLLTIGAGGETVRISVSEETGYVQ
jgi:MSHA pilin protein MshC